MQTEILEYVLTDNEDYVIINANHQGFDVFGRLSHARWVTKRNSFYALDIGNKTLHKMRLQPPPKVRYYKGITMTEKVSNERNKALISGFFNECFKRKKMLADDVWNMILMWYGMDVRLHLIGDEGGHWKINFNAVLKDD